MNDLGDYVNRNQKYIIIKDGDSFEGRYIGFQVVPAYNDPTKETGAYSFEIDGIGKIFKTASVKFANAMKKVDKGQTLRITRHGEMLKTHYDITVL